MDSSSSSSSSSSLSSLSGAAPTTSSTNPPPDRCRTEAVKRELSIRTRSFSLMYSSPSASPLSPSSSSSSSTRLSSPFALPSPVRPTTLSSSVPFSWESKPGVPKTSPGAGQPKSPNPGSPLLLPPPPPLRSEGAAESRRRLKKNAMAFDPFTVALMECSKERDYWKMSPVRETTKQQPNDEGRSRLRPRVLGYLFSLDLYPSCKTTIASSVANSNVYIRRRYEVLHRRSDSGLN